MYYVEANGAFEAIIEVGITGLVGTIAIELADNQSNIVFGPTTADIIEQPPGSGSYSATSLVAPAQLGQYAIIWSDDGTFTDGHTEVDDLTVVADTGGNFLPPLPPVGPGPGAQPGPCNAWTTGEAVAACCDVEVEDESVFDQAVDAATRTLWALSGRQFSGTCDITVRPTWTGGHNCFQVLSRGHIVQWDGYRWGWEDATGANTWGCSHHLTEVLLYYPVREVVEVKVDGAVIADTNYLLYDRRRLIGANGYHFPRCQRFDLEDTETGTFSIRFTYGVNPPNSGTEAANQLACEVYKACSNQECALPTGVTRISRQGVTIERSFFARDPSTGAWNTGLSLVDQFLNEVNPSGLRRRPAIYSPDVKYPRPSPVAGS